MGCKVKELRFGLHKCRTPAARRREASKNTQTAIYDLCFV